LFLSKNPKGLEELYSEDITLTDWNGQWKGRLAVLEMNENLFNNDFHLKIDEVRISGNRTYGHIQLEIGGSTLKIVDVIDWSNDGKIKHITAYSG
jgi:hypothetical protein